MKKFTLLTSMVVSCIAIAQNDKHIDHTHLDPLNQQVCGNNLEMEKAFIANPQLRIQHEQDQAQFEIDYQNYLQNEYDPNARAAYTVPVVVHVIHENGAENISDDQVYDAIMRLNEDFSMTNNDLSAIVPSFTGIIGNTDVEFKLATKDPQGNCHLGITRTFMSGGGTHDTGDNGDIRTAVQNEHGNWPQNRYMNVFVVKSITGSAAYTNTPGNWYSATSMSGSIYMGHTVMGSIGTANMSSRHILSHEVGHWLNLRHTWGPNNSAGDPGSCSSDDNVADTPNTIGWVGVCDYDGETCGSLDNVQNIMDYSGSCRSMFTQGQSARMQTALNSSTAQRNNLWTASNLAFTGTNGPGALCEANFSSNVRVVCAGQSVTFSDDSYHSVSSRDWTFTGGTPSTSTSATPTVTYNTPGVYAVTLDVSDGTSTLVNTDNDYIVVLSNTGEPIPHHEGFEQVTTIPDNQNWLVEDYGGGNTWQLTNSYGAGGSLSSAWLNNYGNIDGTKDDLMSGTIDLSGVDPAESMLLTFEYAYRKVNPANNEWLRFYISNDCGETWVLRKNIYGDNLSDITASGSYVPSSELDWYYVEITNINSLYYVENFRYKFEFENDAGNNFYLDNINLYPTAMSNIADQNASDNLNVYPNPTNGNTNIEVVGKIGVDYQISVYSTVGQKVATVHQGQLDNGLNKFEFDASNLAKGIYMVRIEGGGRLQTVKFIKD